MMALTVREQICSSTLKSIKLINQGRLNQSTVKPATFVAMSSQWRKGWLRQQRPAELLKCRERQHQRVLLDAVAADLRRGIGL
ncbi:hypothetical protein BRADI_2g17893v3 [Brachypodium distachyon]|uniref:Uncharacterized protein n=1 Tax=Brachypodium distachyon TaxID=15368 RepID=A0A0Q3G0N3_BRADI|nr:hypothetical protein BRADI_2g17893v3 [Brachypodium distachyon]